MTRRAALVACAFLAAASPALALQTPQPCHKDEPRVRCVPYDPANVIRLPAVVGGSLDGRQAAFLVKVERLAGDLSEVRLFHTSVTRAIATWPTWPGEPGFTGTFEDFVAAVGAPAAGPGLPVPAAPDVPAMAAAASRFDTEIVPGMVFTIEPMLTLGTHEWEGWDDGWTVVTKDRSITAQFEHTIVVRETGAEILTLPSA